MKKIMNRIERFIVIQLVIFVMVGELSVKQMVKEESVEVDEVEVFGVGFPGIGDVEGEEVAADGFEVIERVRHTVVAVEDDDGIFFFFDNVPEDGEDEGVGAGDVGAGCRKVLRRQAIVGKNVGGRIGSTLCEGEGRMWGDDMEVMDEWGFGVGVAQGLEHRLEFAAEEAAVPGFEPLVQADRGHLQCGDAGAQETAGGVWHQQRPWVEGGAHIVRDLDVEGVAVGAQRLPHGRILGQAEPLAGCGRGVRNQFLGQVVHGEHACHRPMGLRVIASGIGEGDEAEVVEGAVEGLEIVAQLARALQIGMGVPAAR